MTAEDVVDILSIPLIGVVPDDENVVIATNRGEPLVGSSTLAGRAYRNICYRVMGKQIPLENGKPISLFSKLSGMLHKSREGSTC